MKLNRYNNFLNENVSNSEIMEIVPEDMEDGQSNPNAVRVPWCYLHGELQEDAGYDIFGVVLPDRNKNMIQNNQAILLEGIYSCHYEGKPCLFYY